MPSYQFRLSSEASPILEMEIAFRDDAAAIRYAQTFRGYEVEVVRDQLSIGQVRKVAAQRVQAWWFRASPLPSWLAGAATR